MPEKLKRILQNKNWRSWKKSDWLLLALEIALPVLVLAFGDAEAAYTPDLYIAPLRGLPVLGFAAYAVFLLIPTVLHIKETVQWNISISKI